MKRKVSQIGPSTLMVSLPISWVKRYGIKKGDELDIEENGSQITIDPKKITSKTAYQLDLKEKEMFLKRYLFVLYKYGYDEIHITSPEKINATELQLAINDMEGFEIFDQKEKLCNIKSITSGIDTEFNNILKRLFQINKTMAKEGLAYAQANDFKNLTAVQNLELNNNRLTNLCERYLNKHGYKENHKTMFIYVFLNLLEIAADKYRDISKYIVENNLKLSKETIEAYTNINRMFEQIYEMFYNFNFAKMPHIKKEREACKARLIELLPLKKGKEIIIISNLQALWDIYHHMELLLFYI